MAPGRSLAQGAGGALPGAQRRCQRSPLSQEAGPQPMNAVRTAMFPASIATSPASATAAMPSAAGREQVW